MDSAHETTAYSRIDTPEQNLTRGKVMGSMIRSEEMVLCQLFIQPEAAYSTISELGEAGIVQFRDLNETINSFQRKYATEVKRCDEMERQLRYFEAEMKKDGVNIPELTELPRAPNPREMINLEARLEKTEGDIVELSQNARNLKTSYLELCEMQHVLEKSQLEQEQSGRMRGESVVSRTLIDEDSLVNRGRLGFVAGTVERERIPAFERMLWRVSRGNVFLRQMPLDKPFEDPITGNELYKTVFAAFFQGEQLKSRVMKICSGFRASLYPVPDTEKERSSMLNDIKTRIQDLNTVLNQTQDHRSRVLVSVAKDLQTWTVMVRKMKAIYHTLNMFNDDVTKKCLIGECWTPVNDLPIVQDALRIGSTSAGCSIASFLNIINANEIPPTFHRTNRFTKGFQNIIDAYGIASYREANPALYSIITFPFLFAVMFGDLGHGLIMFLFALFMVIREEYFLKKKSSNEIWNIYFAGRYIILLMGLFSMYTGFVYNDIFAKSMNIFGSRWHNYFSQEEIANRNGTGGTTFYPDFGYKGTPYVYGMDPVWQLADNKLIFSNSYKMKLAIIIGICHMLFGIFMTLVNIVHFKRWSEIFVEFVPHVIFLSCLILYLVFMIFYKWIKYSVFNEKMYGAACAPSILILFIGMFLQSDPEVADEGCGDGYMYANQKYIQYIILILAVVCVPIMLCGKPLIIMRRRKNAAKYSRHENGIELTSTALNSQDNTPAAASTGGAHDHDDLPMTEVWINQGIHTIEFCLNAISHTASYLRLWALSLAHAQLSEVLWTMVLSMGLKGESYSGAVVLYFIFGIWAFFSLAILVVMEGLSAFLHTLRLHWVEFMSKFYAGEGYAFEPFKFTTLLNENEEE